jgi:phenylpropionate dioxygenase-like ring-hydroxylating dioxygenase large terminal subunit
MIRNQWYAVLNSKELKKGKVLGTTRLGEKLVFWRNKSGEVGCAHDKCAHRGAKLSQGKIVNGNIQCPFHGFEYDTSGKCQFIPARGKANPVPKRFFVNSYPAKDAHGFIWIWWGEQKDDLPPIPFFEDIDGDFIYDTLIDHWPTHYSRVIENQLDVLHLPFVHYNTIGRGDKTLVNGPITKWEDDELQVWVRNQKDDGRKPKQADDLPEPTEPALLHFRFPNIWQNRISEKVRVLIAFVPVDEENTLFYARFYQKFWRLPLSGKLIAKIGSIGNRIIERQDKRVVSTQEPKRSQLKMDEKLVKGDKPVIEYRRRRQKLIEENN